MRDFPSFLLFRTTSIISAFCFSHELYMKSFLLPFNQTLVSNLLFILNIYKLFKLQLYLCIVDKTRITSKSIYWQAFRFISDALFCDYRKNVIFIYHIIIIIIISLLLEINGSHFPPESHSFWLCDLILPEQSDNKTFTA